MKRWMVTLVASIALGILLLTTHAEEKPLVPKTDSQETDSQGPALSDGNIPALLSAETPANAATVEPQARALGEILSIRNRRGGILEGTTLEFLNSDSDSKESNSTKEDETFSGTLRGVMKKFAPPKVAALESASPQAGQGEPYAADLPARGLVAILRQASRRLDQKANDLEDEQQYRQADRLRCLANHIRLETRELERPPN